MEVPLLIHSGTDHANKPDDSTAFFNLFNNLTGLTAEFNALPHTWKNTHPPMLENRLTYHGVRPAPRCPDRSVAGQGNLTGNHLLITG
jgi:hypothetical protein